MIKVYTCVSEISFNLKINGNKKRINFDPISGGKSQYRTNKKDVQEGIERLDQFDTLIHLSDSINEASDLLGDQGEGGEVVVNGKVLDTTAGGEGKELLGDGGGHIDNGGSGKDVQEEITSFADAKEYLLTHGCDKTVRSREHIVAYAAELGIEFPNLK